MFPAVGNDFFIDETFPYPSWTKYNPHKPSAVVITSGQDICVNSSYWAEVTRVSLLLSSLRSVALGFVASHFCTLPEVLFCLLVWKLASTEGHKTVLVGTCKTRRFQADRPTYFAFTYLCKIWHYRGRGYHSTRFSCVIRLHSLPNALVCHGGWNKFKIPSRLFPDYNVIWRMIRWEFRAILKKDCTGNSEFQRIFNL